MNDESLEVRAFKLKLNGPLIQCDAANAVTLSRASEIRQGTSDYKIQQVALI